MKTLLSFVLALASTVSSSVAAVVYVDIEDRYYQEPVPDFPDDFDINADGIADFRVRTRSAELLLVPLGFYLTEGSSSNRVAVDLAPSMRVGGYVTNFSEEMEVGAVLGESEWVKRIAFTPTVETGGHLNSCLNPPGCDGNFVTDETRYAGLEFYDLDHEPHYAWLAFRKDDSQLSGGVLEGWAYETIPGKSILAGAIPEPSAGLLTLLGMAVFFARRRRR